tara:strand:+ start:554 stop:865 length:312 start_codon:yes stop_codon:yes gene_type:complete
MAEQTSTPKIDVDARIRILRKYIEKCSASELFDKADVAELQKTLTDQLSSKRHEFEHKCKERLTILKHFDDEMGGLRNCYPELNTYFVTKQKTMQEQLQQINN